MAAPRAPHKKTSQDPHERLLVLYKQLQEDLDNLKKQGQVLASKLQKAADQEKIVGIEQTID